MQITLTLDHQKFPPICDQKMCSKLSHMHVQCGNVSSSSLIHLHCSARTHKVQQDSLMDTQPQFFATKSKHAQHMERAPDLGKEGGPADQLRITTGHSRHYALHRRAMHADISGGRTLRQVQHAVHRLQHIAVRHRCAPLVISHTRTSARSQKQSVIREQEMHPEVRWALFASCHTVLPNYKVFWKLDCLKLVNPLGHTSCH